MGVSSGVRPRVGDVLAEKYRIEAVLGEGAMGIVVAAMHVELGRRVAIKLMKPEVLDGPQGIDRFMREARAAGQLRSDHSCQVTDVGRFADGTPFIVMELLEGENLHARLEREGPLPVADVVRYALQICDAMSEAHRLGIVHRDLKPHNLFRIRRPDGRDAIKVLDFGVSKVGDEPGLTRTFSVVGTPAYMSPEQMSSSKYVDARTDLWAIGIVMYQLLVGRVPFEGGDLVQLSVAIATRPPSHPSTLRPEVPTGLGDVVMRCLARDRELRYATAGDLASALRPFGDVRVLPLSTPLHLAGPTDLTIRPGGSTSGLAMMRAGKRRRAIAVVIAAIAGAAAIGVAVVARGSASAGEKHAASAAPPPTPPPEPPPEPSPEPVPAALAPTPPLPAPTPPPPVAAAPKPTSRPTHPVALKPDLAKGPVTRPEPMTLPPTTAPLPKPVAPPPPAHGGCKPSDPDCGL